MSQPSNAIAKRLEKLANLWEECAANDQIQVCRWLLLPDEFDLIEAFCAFEATEHGYTEDLFFYIQTPFSTETEYDQAIALEILSILENEFTTLTDNNININQAPESLRSARHSSWYSPLEIVLPHLEDFKGRAVVVLVPQLVSDERHWALWVERAIRNGVPSQISMMVLDALEKPQLTALNQLPAVKTIKPDLDMAGAIKEMAATGDPKDPGVQFRQLFVAFSQAIQRNDFQEAEKTGQKAAGICRQQDWPALEVAVHVQSAAIGMYRKDSKYILACYDLARRAAISARTQDTALAERLLAQIALYEGGHYISYKEPQKALIAFEEAARSASKADDPYFEMEACRMAGYSCQLSGDATRAWEFNLKALDAAARIEDPEIRRNSTLPHVGRALLQLVEKLNRYRDEEIVRRRMDELAGPGWEKISVSPQTTTA